MAVLQRRSKSLILLFTGGVLLAVAALQVADLYYRRKQTLDTAGARATNLAFILSEYVRESFAVADTALRQLVIHGAKIDATSVPTEAWEPILHAAQAVLPGSGAISVADARGIIRHATQPKIIGQSRADNYLVKRLAAAADDELVVDTPILSYNAPHRVLIPIGRRLVGTDGAYAGAVVATLSPDVFRDFFHTVDDGKEGIIWVLHPAGGVLFREPAEPAPGFAEADAESTLLQASPRPGQTRLVTGPLVPGGPAYVTAYRSMATPPLVVAVSLSQQEVLEGWVGQARGFGLALAVLTLTIAGMLLVLVRQMDARTHVERELQEVQRQEADRLRLANERLADALEYEQRARRDTEAASYLKDEFLMTVSHELRTPMTAIYGWVRMLASDAVPPEAQPRAFSVIERNARAQTQLIDDLLDVSRAISGKLRIHARPVNVSDVVLAAVETITPALQAKSIRLESDIDEQLDPILADPDRLQQIVWNLLSNAIKFTPEGGLVRLRVRRTELSAPESTPGGAEPRTRPEVHIEVSDTGIGIPGEFLPFVFDRFRQAEGGTRRRYGGLGLGLAIVRHLVELHGGTVVAASPGEGRGATFRVSLPGMSAASMASRADAGSDSVAATPGPAPALRNIRVLVVDDDADARELFSSILGSAGAAVLTAASAADALQLLNNGVDVLLSDIEMPGEDGYQLLRRARAHPAVKGTRMLAIAVTAYARSADQRRAIEAGFDRHLTKPVDPTELIAVIASLAKGVRSQFSIS